MDQATFIGGIILLGFIVFVTGHSFIDSFFKHKEELIKRTVKHVKGEV